MRIPIKQYSLKTEVKEEYSKNFNDQYVAFYLGKSALQDINKKQTMTLWQIERSFRVKINSASYVNVRDGGKV